MLPLNDSMSWIVCHTYGISRKQKANKESSLAVLVQARGSTVQFCSASNAEKKNINSLKKILK